jgi:hypothetical protein
MSFDFHITRFASLVGFVALLSGCAGMSPGRSEHPVDEAQVAALATGMGRTELVQRLGPPAEEAGYRRLNETVASWRLVEPGNRRMLFNAHFDASGQVKYYSRTPDPATLGGENSSF